MPWDVSSIWLHPVGCEKSPPQRNRGSNRNGLHVGGDPSKSSTAKTVHLELHCVHSGSQAVQSVHPRPSWKWWPRAAFFWPPATQLYAQEPCDFRLILIMGWDTLLSVWIPVLCQFLATILSLTVRGVLVKFCRLVTERSATKPLDAGKEKAFIPLPSPMRQPDIWTGWTSVRWFTVTKGVHSSLVSCQPFKVKQSNTVYLSWSGVAQESQPSTMNPAGSHLTTLAWLKGHLQLREQTLTLQRPLDTG